MKADTQVIGGLLIFAAGLFVGQTVKLGGLPNWDYAGWANALASGLLVVAAYKGFREWQRQFVAGRDHDLAIRFLMALHKVHTTVDEFRTPTGMLSDADVPMEPAESLNDPESDRQYRLYSARYRARQMHLVAAAEERQFAVTEIMSVWGDLGAEMGATVNALASIEGDVVREGHKWIETFVYFDNTTAREKVNRDLLFAPANDKEDLVMMVYERGLQKLKQLVEPKIRMRTDSAES